MLDIKVVEQKTVFFYDDELIAVRGSDGQIYVSLRHLCDSLGIDRPSQVRRIGRNEVLAEGYAGGAIMTPPAKTGGGGLQKAGLLRVDLVPLWLSGLQAKSVKEAIRPKVRQYQREAAKVLWEAFQDGRLSMDSGFSDLLKRDTPEVVAYRNALAVVQMARRQLLMATRIDLHEDRLEAIEAVLGSPERYIDNSQASKISQAVKALALLLGKRTGRNEFGGIYGELYRRFDIASYRELPAAKYDEAMRFLREWYGSIADSDKVPF